MGQDAVVVQNIIIRMLSDLNRQIIEAAEEGDIIRWDVIDTTIENCEIWCQTVKICGHLAYIEKEEVWGVYNLNYDGVNSIFQFRLNWDGQTIVCDCQTAEKKGA